MDELALWIVISIGVIGYFAGLIWLVNWLIDDLKLDK